MMTLMVVEVAASLVPSLVISTFVASPSPEVVPLDRSLSLSLSLSYAKTHAG